MDNLFLHHFFLNSEIGLVLTFSLDSASSMAVVSSPAKTSASLGSVVKGRLACPKLMSVAIATNLRYLWQELGANAFAKYAVDMLGNLIAEFDILLGDLTNFIGRQRSLL